MNTLARLRRRLSYANVIATLALFFSLTGASMAGVKYLVPSETVPATSDLAGSTYGNPQIAAGKVTTAKIADGSITSAKLNSSVLAELESRVDALETLLANVSLHGNTLRLSGVNLQVVNAAGPNTVDGLGNVIIGYHRDVDTQDGPDTRTGSHNLVIGDEHSFSSLFGVVSGLNNTTSGPYAVATGVGNTAGAWGSFIGGGEGNRATDVHAFVGGGVNNIAGLNAFVGGGFLNRATGTASFVSGTGNTASGSSSFVGGGTGKTAGPFASCAWLADMNIVPC